ncbi:MAG: MmcB family DNA repair protein [Hyphomicrobiaceae bacterium]|nr:MmcB family DNA repair protein [Hyphomicrobiaceae bacterium]
MTATSRNPFAPRCTLDPDGRLSPAAAAIQRGAIRVLNAHGFAAVTELVLTDGRRADVMGLADSGEIWIVEVKSCLADFRADTKWPDYLEACDRLWFAVDADFPIEVLPQAAGVILCDRFGGEIMREAPTARLPAARRRSIIVRFARTAANRLVNAADPSIGAIGVRD